MLLSRSFLFYLSALNKWQGESNMEEGLLWILWKCQYQKQDCQTDPLFLTIFQSTSQYENGVNWCQNCPTLLTSLSRQRRRISQIRSISNTKPGRGESSRAAAWAAEICCNVHLHSVFSQHAADKTLAGGERVTGDFADCNNYHFHRITPQTSVCLECVGSAVSSPPDNHLYSPHTLSCSRSA